jgi:hypothetical protein
MKKNIILGIVSAAFIFGGCKDYLDVNDNPNQPISATPELVLTNALNVSAARLNHNEIGAFWGGHWSPSGSVSGFTQEKTYDITTTFRTGIWNSPYDNALDYQYVVNQSLATGKKAIAGMALVMKAYDYQILVDAYNNIPYSEALKGTIAIRPKYDDAKVVYDSLFKAIDKGVQYLNLPITSENANPKAADIYFGGDNAKWIKFANTLKLRMLIRISGVADKAAFITAEMAKFGTTSAAFLGAGENVQASPGYIKTGGKMNPFYENYGYTAADARSGSHDFYCYSAFFVNSLVANTDPRIDRLAYKPTAAPTGSHVGVPFGEGNDQFLYTKISGYGPAFMPQDAGVGASTLFSRPQVVMTSAESFFLQAEAVQKGLLVSDKSAQVLYESGIGESFSLLGVPNSAASAVTYYGQAINNVGFAASTDKLTAIRTQKWISLVNFGGFEAWTEYRRTGVPNIPLSTKALGTKQPTRLLYPLSEYSSNTENVNAQGKIDHLSSKIFWAN